MAVVFICHSTSTARKINLEQGLFLHRDRISNLTGRTSIELTPIIINNTSMVITQPLKQTTNHGTKNEATDNTIGDTTTRNRALE